MLAGARILGGMTWIDCGPEHLEAIRAIFNDAIENTTALYECEQRPVEFMTEWFAAKQAHRQPVLGALDDDGSLMGFGSYGPFRSQAAFRWTVEHSLYVAEPYRRRGLGRQVLQRLVERAGEQRFHLMIGVIDADNRASITLHEELGFEASGCLRQSGFKFGRWLDVVLYQRVLGGPP